MANARFIFANHWDSATLIQSTGDSAPLLPVTHTQQYNNSRVFRSESTQPITLLFNWQYPVFLDAFTLWRHNLTSGAQLRIELFNQANQAGDPVYDSGLIPADIPKVLGDLVWGKDPLGVSTYSGWRTATRAVWFEQTRVVLSGRLTILNSDNPSGYIEIGRIYAGETFSPTFNIDLGHVFQWETQSDAHPTAGGSVHTLDTAVYRRVSFSLSHLNSADRAQFSELSRNLSIHKDFFIALRPQAGGTMERDYSFAAKFEQLPSLTAQASRYETQCSIREV